VELQQSVIRTPIKLTLVSLVGGLTAWYVSLHRRQWTYKRNSERRLYRIGQRSCSLRGRLCLEQAALDMPGAFAHVHNTEKMGGMLGEDVLWSDCRLNLSACTLPTLGRALDSKGNLILQ
jgi:hypothetical protein